MNPSPSCGCYPPAYCDACKTTCSPQPTCPGSPYRKIKLEPQNKYQPICSTKNCVIFGGHDTNPFPEYPCSTKNKKPKDKNRNTLGSTIGLVISNVNFKTEGKPIDIIQARYATYLKAFARLHLNDETTWNSKLIDDIMKEGLLLYSTSEKKKNQLESPSNIYEESEKNILREFKMSDCSFQVELMKKFTLNSTESTEKGAEGDRKDELILENLKRALKMFFRQNKYCLLTVGSFYVLIWRSQDAYFVFDVCGRRVSDFRTDPDQGVAMLMCLKTLENIRHLIASLSYLKLTDPICLREIKIVKVTTPSGDIIQRDYKTRSHQYHVINDDYAYLKAGLHLTLNKEDLLRNRSALSVGIAAMVVSKIEHPATWNTNMLDKILCFGVTLCQACWTNCVMNETIDVTEFPCLFDMGQFRVSIELIDRKYDGYWRCIPDYKYSELARAIEKAFAAGDEKLLVQINYQMYAIWKKHGYIYLLDPYRHRILGKEDESDVYEEMEKSSTVRIFRNFEVFINTFNHILLDSNRTSNFSIKVLKINGIRLKDSPDPEIKLDVKGEVMSINEHICFEEAENLCLKALGEISDYEDDDLKSDMDEMELKTSSSEAEDVEEAEAGAEGEEIEGLETSSSGEEGAGGGQKTKGKGSKRGKTKKGSKTGKSQGGKGVKGGKGKGSKDDEEGNDNESSEEEHRKKERKTKVAGKNQTKEGDNKTKAKDGGAKDKDGVDQVIGGNAKDKDGKPKDKEKSSDNENKHGKDEDKDGSTKHKDGKDKDKDGKQKGRDKSKDKNKKKKYLSENENLDKNVVSKDEEKNKDKKENDKDGQDRANVQHKNKNQTEANSSEKEKPVQSKDSKLKTRTDAYNYQSEDENKENKDENKTKDKNSGIEKEIDKDNDKDLGRTIGKSISGNDKEIERHGEHKSKVNENRKRTDLPDKHGKQDTTSKSASKDGKAGKDIDLSQTRSEFPTDGTEADDENEDSFRRDDKRHHCSGPNPNRYPGYFKCPTDMAVVASESGSFSSICKLFQAGFKVADRVLTLTPWGNFVVFRCLGRMGSNEKHYFLFDGCTCNVNRFRHLDLTSGTAGLIYFQRLHNVIEYIRQVGNRRNKENQQSLRKETINDICRQYCC